MPTIVKKFIPKYLGDLAPDPDYDVYDYIIIYKTLINYKFCENNVMDYLNPLSSFKSEFHKGYCPDHILYIILSVLCPVFCKSLDQDFVQDSTLIVPKISFELRQRVILKQWCFPNLKSTYSTTRNSWTAATNLHLIRRDLLESCIPNIYCFLYNLNMPNHSFFNL